MAAKRTMSALQAFFEPGQPAGSITPDRVQDAIFSLQGGWGRISLTAPALTTITTQGQWVKAAGTTELAQYGQQFDMPQNGRLRATSPVPSILDVSAVISIEDGANKTFEAAIALNGNILESTIRTIRLGSSGAIEEAVILADFLQAENDYVEIFLRNMTDAADVTVTRLYMRARTYVV